MTLGHKGFYENQEKAKRISSVALCVLMPLTALPITAVTVNALQQ